MAQGPSSVNSRDIFEVKTYDGHMSRPPVAGEELLGWSAESAEPGASEVLYQDAHHNEMHTHLDDTHTQMGWHAYMHVLDLTLDSKLVNFDTCTCTRWSPPSAVRTPTA